VKNAGDRERQKRMLRPNALNEVRPTGSRRGGKPVAADPGAQLDTVD
jgi:hypothetical protein